MGDFYSVTMKMNATPGAIPQTIGQIIAGATKRIRLHEVHIGSSSASALAGCRLSVGRPTTAGTGGAAVTPQVLTDGAPAAIFTALSAETVWSAEPTQPSRYLHELGLDAVASYVWVPKDPVVAAVSTRLGFRVEVDNSATKVQWTITAVVEE